MNRPSARHVPPEFDEDASAWRSTTDPCTRLLQERIVLLGTRIDDVSANEVTARLLHLEHQAPDRDISLYVNSPGGSLGAMSAIYDTMRFVGCDVETACLGQACSSAAVLPAAGTPGRRYALPAARVVLRQPALSEPVRGRADDLALRAAELTRVRDRLTEMLVRHTGRDPEQVGADIERERIMDAREALEHGLIDRVVPDRRTPRSAPGAR